MDQGAIEVSAKDRFAKVTADLMDRDGTIEQGPMLRAPGLKVFGKFFAFAPGDDIVVKLSAARVQELIASGAGRACAIRKGAPMREWVRLVPENDRQCAAYLQEGRKFVADLYRR